MEVPILLPYITVQCSKSMSYEEHHFFQFPSDVYPWENITPNKEAKSTQTQFNAPNLTLSNTPLFSEQTRHLSHLFSPLWQVQMKRLLHLLLPPTSCSQCGISGSEPLQMHSLHWSLPVQKSPWSRVTPSLHMSSHLLLRQPQGGEDRICCPQASQRCWGQCDSSIPSAICQHSQRLHVGWHRIQGVHLQLLGSKHWWWLGTY